MTLIVFRNTIFKMINIWQHHVWTDMQKRLASVHSILGRGSLIPLPTIDVGETSQIKQQAFRVTMTFMVLRITIFKMTKIWRLHAKKDMYKRLASVHSKVRRGSLIPQPSIDVRGADQIKQQAKTVIMILKNFPKGCHQYDGQLEIQTCRRGLPMSTQL